ncbi:MAG TPA: hypothetical protein VFG69_06790, partial [Nannocystaceae bacterium]|nr:hypothetical protein [Nannocystaceae bacterium]
MDTSTVAAGRAFSSPVSLPLTNGPPATHAMFPGASAQATNSAAAVGVVAGVGAGVGVGVVAVVGVGVGVVAGVGVGVVVGAGAPAPGEAAQAQTNTATHRTLIHLRPRQTSPDMLQPDRPLPRLEQ